MIIEKKVLNQILPRSHVLLLLLINYCFAETIFKFNGGFFFLRESHCRLIERSNLNANHSFDTIYKYYLN